MLAPLLFPWPRNGPSTFLILESPLATIGYMVGCEVEKTRSSLTGFHPHHRNMLL